jgi:hypothetical protein
MDLADSLKIAIKMAILPSPGIPKWKAWRLRHPETDKQQMRANYCPNVDKSLLKRVKVSGIKIRLNRDQLTNGSAGSRLGRIIPVFSGVQGNLGEILRYAGTMKKCM